MTPTLVTYVVTFLIAGGFWLLHQFTFHFIRHVDAFLVWVNLIFLMLVSLLPFSAGLMGHLLVHPISQLFYFGNQLAMPACSTFTGSTRDARPSSAARTEGPFLTSPSG
jgi:uncharacterized membrane protein